jgi:hypothetical protein
MCSLKACTAHNNSMPTHRTPWHLCHFPRHLGCHMTKGGQQISDVRSHTQNTAG